jgi:hypothetical protein
MSASDVLANSSNCAVSSPAGAVKPHHAMTADGSVVLGYSHLGMLAAARWLMARTKATLIQALQDNPSFELRIVGEFQLHVFVVQHIMLFAVVAALHSLLM